MLNILSRLFGKKDAKSESEETVQSPKLEELLTDIPDCIKPDSRICLDVMTIADCHGNLMQREIICALGEKSPDVVFFLGDNFPNDIEAVLDVVPRNIRMFGVAGNHDFKDVLSPYNSRIFDVNAAFCAADDYSVGGLAGSIRYKEDAYYAMLTNEESEAVMKKIPKVDILITHDKPCFDLPEKITSHSGLTGIGSYITRTKPNIVLHGHLHEKYIKRMGNTIIRSCYGVERFNISF